MTTRKSHKKEVLKQVQGAGGAAQAVSRGTQYQRYLDASLGLRNYWYPAFFSRELQEGETRGELLLGERVFFKRIAGQVYAMEDRCAHRGVPFSARPECYSENTVTCWLHGFTYDVRDGKLVHILTDPDSSVIGNVTLKTYPVQELHGVVFTFVGDMDPPPPLADDLQPRVHSKGLAFHPIARHKIRSNWRLAAENGYDSAHLYGHRNTYIVTEVGVPVPFNHMSENAEVEVFEGSGSKGVGDQRQVPVWSADVEGVRVSASNVDPDNPPQPMNVWVGLFMPGGLEVDYFPAPGMVHFEWYVPMDENHHMYVVLQGKYVEDEEEERQFHEAMEEGEGRLTWNQPGEEPAGFVNFDQFVRENMNHAYASEDWWNREVLFKPDTILVRWRTLVSRHARGIQTRGDWAATNGWSPTGDGYQPARSPGHW